MNTLDIRGFYNLAHWAVLVSEQGNTPSFA
jgi:hypothetical protein